MRAHLQVQVEGALPSDDGQGGAGDTRGYVSYGEGAVGMVGGRAGEERDKLVRTEFPAIRVVSSKDDIDWHTVDIETRHPVDSLGGGWTQCVLEYRADSQRASER